MPGVNGAASSALKGLQSQQAEAAGFGKGEFSAWTNNLRALVSAVLTSIMGNTYAWSRRTDAHPGVAWLVAGFIGAVLPELLAWRMTNAELAPLPSK